MAYERRIPVYNSNEGILLRKSHIRKLPFDGGGVNSIERLSLFVTRKTALQYLWKNEPVYPAQYRTIDDTLDAEHTEAARAGAVRRVSVDFTHSPVQAIRNG